MKYLRRIAAIILCAAIITLTSCSDRDSGPSGQIINYNISVEPVTLDPQIANDSGARLIIMNIFEGLVRLDKDSNPGFGVAENWDTSSDDTVYTFTLRKNACWEDGSPLTSDDFLFAFRRLFDPQTASPAASSLFCIKNAQNVCEGNLDASYLGVSAPDTNTLIIELSEPYPDFLRLLATPAAMPCNKAFFESTGGQYGKEHDKILANGPFYIRSSGWAHDEYISLRRSSRYTGRHDPVPAGLEITISEDPEDVCKAIADGTVDCYALPGSEAQRAADIGLNLTSFGDTVWGITFNTQACSETLTPELRRILLSSLNRSYLLKSLPEGCVPTEDIIPGSAKIGSISYRSLSGSRFLPRFSVTAKYDLQNAMKKAGITKLPDLNILCTDDSATQTIVNNIMETWNNITGSYSNKTPVSRSELVDRVSSGRFIIAVAPLSVDGDSPLDTLRLFYSDSQNNPAFLADSVYDELIESIGPSPDTDSIPSIVAAEKYIAENGIFYPLFLESRYYASASNVTGIIFHPYGAEADFIYASKTPR